MAGFLAEAKAWAEGRWWQWRVALLLLLAWDGFRHLRDPEAGGLFAGITFGVHEFGHMLFALFGEFMTAAGGSINQLLIPVGAGALLYHYRDFFGIAVAGTWLSSSLMDLARYIGDARAQELDLVGFGEDPQHDWWYLLQQFNATGSDTRIAAITRGLGVIVLLGSMLFGTWISLQMAVRRSEVGNGQA